MPDAQAWVDYDEFGNPQALLTRNAQQDRWPFGLAVAKSVFADGERRSAGTGFQVIHQFNVPASMCQAGSMMKVSALVERNTTIAGAVDPVVQIFMNGVWNNLNNELSFTAAWQLWAHIEPTIYFTQQGTAVAATPPIGTDRVTGIRLLQAVNPENIIPVRVAATVSAAGDWLQLRACSVVVFP